MRVSKNFVFRLLMGLTLLAAALLWLLGVIPPSNPVIGFTGVGSVGQWAAFTICAGWGTAFVIRGFAKKDTVGTLKKLNIIFGFILITFGVVVIISMFGWNGAHIYMPIIAVGLAFAFLIAMIAVGGRRFDAGINDEVGFNHAYKKTTWETRNEHLAAAKKEKENEKTDE